MNVRLSPVPLRAVLYARYSTNEQSKESSADQFRVCERLAEYHHFTVVGRYADEAISGGTSKRDDYQKMLLAARHGEFDVVIAEDTSRIWRNLAEQSPRVAELADLGVHVVTQDLDTREESADLIGPLNGAIAQR